MRRTVHYIVTIIFKRGKKKTTSAAQVGFRVANNNKSRAHTHTHTHKRKKGNSNGMKREKKKRSVYVRLTWVQPQEMKNKAYMKRKKGESCAQDFRNTADTELQNVL